MKQLKEDRKKLVELLPDIFKQIYEIVEIQRIADIYLDDANDKAKNTLDNEFVETADDLLQRHEKIVGLKDDQDSVENKKKKIIAAINIDGSLTKAWLKKQVDIRCGAGKYQIIEVDRKSYLYIATDFDRYSQAVSFCDWLNNVIPMNVKFVHDNFHRKYVSYRTEYCGTKPYPGTLGSIAKYKIVYYVNVKKSKYRVEELNDQQCGTVNGTGTAGSSIRESISIKKDDSAEIYDVSRLNGNTCEGTCGSVTYGHVAVSGTDENVIVLDVKHCGTDSDLAIMNKTQNRVLYAAKVTSNCVDVSRCGVNYCGQ